LKAPSPFATGGCAGWALHAARWICADAIFYYNEKRVGWQVRRICKAKSAIRQTGGFLPDGFPVEHERRKNSKNKQPRAVTRLKNGSAVDLA